MQYNLAAIKAQGTENLPQEWKNVSPINRLKTKIRFEKIKLKVIKEQQQKS